MLGRFRFIATVALVALALAAVSASGGCSYDWTIGGETPAAVPSGTATTPVPGSLSPTDTDSGAADSAAQVPPGQATECGPKCACKDKQCNYTCTTGSCAVACNGESVCRIACARGARCALDCTDKASCTVDCTAGGATCELDCTSEATCAGTCKAASICSRNCDGKHCAVDCTGGGICL